MATWHAYLCDSEVSESQIQQNWNRTNYSISTSNAFPGFPSLEENLQKYGHHLDISLSYF